VFEWCFSYLGARTVTALRGSASYRESGTPELVGDHLLTLGLQRYMPFLWKSTKNDSVLHQAKASVGQ
jgi:hypothetical protein